MNSYEIKLFIREHIPTRMFTALSLPSKFLEAIKCYSFDIKKVLKSLFIESSEKFNYEFLLNSHAIEKGLAHKNLRFEFGINNLKRLNIEIGNWKKKYKGIVLENIYYLNVLSALSEYVEIHKSCGHSVDFLNNHLSIDILEDLSNYNSKITLGGTHNEQLLDINKSKNSFCQISKTRFSVREFKDDVVDVEKIIKCVEVAQHAPSSCNRQPIKVYFTEKIDKITEFQKIHGGLNGTTPPGIIVVTADIVAYPNFRSRSLPFVDGGLFIMNLILALQEKYIGNVVLNAAQSIKNEKKLEKLFEIPSTQKIVAYIAVGNMEENMKVGNSMRIPVADIFNLR